MTREPDIVVKWLQAEVLELRAEVERQREHIRKQAEDIIVLGREAGKAADKALIASNDQLHADVERLLDALKAIECHSIDHTDACRMAGKARAALEPKP